MNDTDKKLLDKKLLDARRFGHAEPGTHQKWLQNLKELRYGLGGLLLSLTVCLFFYFTKDCQDNLFFALALWFFTVGVICDISLILKSHAKAAYYTTIASKTLFCVGLICTLMFTVVNL